MPERPGTTPPERKRLSTELREIRERVEDNIAALRAIVKAAERKRGRRG